MRYIYLLDVPERDQDYIPIGLGALTMIYFTTNSLPGTYLAAALGGFAFCVYKLIPNYDRTVRQGLRKLITNQGFYECSSDYKVLYCPDIQYFYDEYALGIWIRLDGSKYRDKYLSLENHLQDIFQMQCFCKEEKDGHIVYLLDRGLTKRLNVKLIEGLKEYSIPINSKISWNFRKCPHALVTGVTGKGKTYFLAYLIKAFTLLKSEIKILDPKMSDLAYLERIFKDDVASTPGQIIKILRETVEKMNERYEQFKFQRNYGFGKDYQDYGFKPIVIFFDEMAALMATVDKKEGKEIMDYCSQIILKGRQAGVFMVLTAQRPDADVIKTSIRDQLGLRIALGEMSKTAYTMVFGSEFNDLELNCSEPGNGFIFIDGINTKPVKFQSPLFDTDYNFVKDLYELKSAEGKKIFGTKN